MDIFFYYLPSMISRDIFRTGIILHRAHPQVVFYRYNFVMLVHPLRRCVYKKYGHSDGQGDFYIHPSKLCLQGYKKNGQL